MTHEYWAFSMHVSLALTCRLRFTFVANTMAQKNVMVTMSIRARRYDERRRQRHEKIWHRHLYKSTAAACYVYAFTYNVQSQHMCCSCSANLLCSDAASIRAWVLLERCRWTQIWRCMLLWRNKNYAYYH